MDSVEAEAAVAFEAVAVAVVEASEAVEEAEVSAEDEAAEEEAETAVDTEGKANSLINFAQIIPFTDFTSFFFFHSILD